jgi:Flp pilus assembly pilin Flp
MRSIIRALRRDDGQDLMEYALLASFIAMVVVAALRLVGPKIAAYYVTINNQF